MSRCLCCVLLLAAGCGRPSGPDAADKEIQRLNEQRTAQPFNASSPLTLADVQDKLRPGMMLGDFDRVVAARNEGPQRSTKVMTRTLLEGDPPRANLKKQVRTYYLRDANLVVVTEFVGPEDEPDEKVVSWRTEPAAGK